jgi:HEAT repeat protein
VKLIFLFLFLFNLFHSYALAQLTAEQLTAFRTAKMARIIVTQSYGEAKDVSLPFRGIARSLLIKYAGLKIIKADQRDFDITFKLQVKGIARGSSYKKTAGSKSEYHYSGASLSGSIIVEIPGIPAYEKSFSGSKSPPSIISFSYKTPSSAPFHEALNESDFVPKLLKLIGEIHGIHPLIAALKDEDSQIRGCTALVLGEFRDSRTIEPLITTMQDGDEEVRKNAAKALGEIKDSRAINALINVLHSGSPDIRELVAELLGEVNDSCVIEALTNALKDKNSAVREKAAKSLSQYGWIPKTESQKIDYFINTGQWDECEKIGEAAAVYLIDYLRDSDPYIRANAIKILGNIKDNQAFDPLINALKDEDSYVRKMAVEALAKTGNEHAVDPIINALEDRDSDVREKAAEMLGEMGGNRAIRPLIKSLKDKDSKVREEAAKSLGNVKDTNAIHPLIAALKDEKPEVRANAIEALIKIGEPSVNPLIAALDDEDYSIRAMIAEALGELGDNRAVEPLINLALHDENFDVRGKAANILGKIKDERAVEPLILALKNEYSVIRSNAAKALGNIKNSQAIKPLISALEDEDHWVRWTAAKSLDNLGWIPENEEKKVLYFIAKNEWHECVKIGEPAVEPLVASMSDNASLVRERAAKALDELNWNPINDRERAIYFIAKNQWQECIKVGSEAVELLIAALEYGGEAKMQAAYVLGEIKDNRAIEPLIDKLRFAAQLLEAKVLEALQKITGQSIGGDYDAWIKWWQKNKHNYQ